MMGFFNANRGGQDLGPPPPPFDDPNQGPRGLGSTERWLLIAGVAVVLFILANVAKEIYTEWLWFQAVGYNNVFVITISAKVLMFVAGALLFLILLFANFFIARRLSPPIVSSFMPDEEVIFARRLINYGILAGGLFLAVIFGSVAGAEWFTSLQFLNAQNFGTSDPLTQTGFGRDVSFYVFILPFLRFIHGWLLGTLVVVLIASVVVYGFSFSLQRFNVVVSPGIKAHLSILGAMIFFVFAWGYWIDAYDLLFSDEGVTFGAGFTDLNARLIVLRILLVVASLAGVTLLVNIFRRGVLLPTIALGAWAVVTFLGGGVFPGIVQRFDVEPNELERERPYINNNIRMTREAFGLDKIQVQPFPAEELATEAALNKNPDTVNNIRLWDVEPLLDTYNQIQSIRLYYDFLDVDVDRYIVDGKLRQVMLGARELSPDRLSAEAQTWINLRLKFTHGYGVAMNPVNEFSPEGLPILWIKDVPPKGFLDITRPEIYYGERTTNYVIVKTKEPEFDYPLGDQNVQTVYEGEGGVPLSSFFRRVLYAWQMADANLVLTDQITQESRIMYYRQIQQRVNHIAPFLTLDGDPYIVVDQGRLMWIQDAYTTTSGFPYSTPYQGGFNYIRNSVKAVIDPYNGKVTFYIAEPDDPIIHTYSQIFPDLFQDLDEMPETLRAHIRFPEDMFNVLATMYQIYHMQDAQVFYNKEDAWDRPREIYLATEQPMNAYYVIMRLPEEETPEFILMLPFTPVNKSNTIGWLAGRSDGENYGKLFAFTFPKEKLIFGPRQVEARIDQDPAISEKFSLWNQSGSRVLRGNLLMIPVENSFIYVEPVYLQAEQSQLPELKQVVFSSGNRLSMQATLPEAISFVYTGMAQVAAREPASTPPTPPVERPPTADGLPQGSSAEALAQAARSHYETALERQKAGDWQGYGDALRSLEETLAQLVEITSQETPSGGTQ